MHIRDHWHTFDRAFQDQFQGRYGQAAFREAVFLIFMVNAHAILKARLPPSEHVKLDAAWYGSSLPNHPLHTLRQVVQKTVADWATDADDYMGSPLQHKFAWMDRQVPRLERYIDSFFN